MFVRCGDYTILSSDSPEGAGIGDARRISDAATYKRYSSTRMSNAFIKSGGADEPKTQYTVDERNEVICTMTEDEVKETFFLG